MARERKTLFNSEIYDLIGLMGMRVGKNILGS